jgi:hypothetical protein
MLMRSQITESLLKDSLARASFDRAILFERDEFAFLEAISAQPNARG